MTDERISRTYTIQYGGGLMHDDPYYDEETFVLHQGDTCPECGRGELKVSKKGNLYCSEICWEQQPELDPNH